MSNVLPTTLVFGHQVPDPIAAVSKQWSMEPLLVCCGEMTCHQVLADASCFELRGTEQLLRESKGKAKGDNMLHLLLLDKTHCFKDN